MSMAGGSLCHQIHLIRYSNHCMRLVQTNFYVFVVLFCFVFSTTLQSFTLWVSSNKWAYISPLIMTIISQEETCYELCIQLGLRHRSICKVQQVVMSSVGRSRGDWSQEVKDVSSRCDVCNRKCPFFHQNLVQHHSRRQNSW